MTSIVWKCPRVGDSGRALQRLSYGCLKSGDITKVNKVESCSHSLFSKNYTLRLIAEKEATRSLKIRQGTSVVKTERDVANDPYISVVSEQPMIEAKSR
eukprot:scaffold11571_cov122-Cylindrotheca_fusiformis.AAC.20